MQVTASNFKAYDIRGVVGKTIDATFAEHLGRAFGTEAIDAGERAVVVGRDGRLSGPELLSYLGRLRGLPTETVTARATELIAVLDLDEAGDKLVADYSTGMRKKITLAAALLHSPKVLLLDEPLEAVDPVSARIIRNVLARYTAGGGTVVFSSHVMALVEGLCSHVAVMAGGRIIAAGELAAVRGSAPSLDDAFMHLVGAADVEEGGLSWLGSSPA